MKKKMEHTANFPEPAEEKHLHQILLNFRTSRSCQGMNIKKFRDRMLKNSVQSALSSYM